jgi:hypothetical protein
MGWALLSTLKVPPGPPKASFQVVRPDFGVVRTYAFLIPQAEDTQIS